MNDDRQLEERLRRLSWPVDRGNGWAGVEAQAQNKQRASQEALPETIRVDERAGGSTRAAPPKASAPRRRSGLRVAVFASITVVLVAAITVGTLEAVKYLGTDQPILVITDDTAGISPGSTGQTTQTAAGEASAAMERGNLERTGVYPDGGPTRLSGVLWKFWTGKSLRSSPAVLDGTVYVGVLPRYLYALDAQTGQQKWFFEAGDRVSSPAVSDGMVYFGSDDGNLYALDARTGQQMWKFNTGVLFVSCPAVSGRTVYFVSADGVLYALDSRSGQQEWSFQTDQWVDFNSSPAVSDGVIYFSTDGEGGSLYAVDATSGQQKWKLSKVPVNARWSFSSPPAVSDGVVYVGSDDCYLNAADIQTGRLKWHFRTGEGAPSSAAVPSSAAISGGAAYVGTDDGHLYAVDINTGQEKWTFTTGQGNFIPTTSPPAISGEVVYFGGPDGVLYAVDMYTGQLLWTFGTAGGDGTGGSPAITGGVVYFVANDGYLYALK